MLSPLGETNLLFACLFGTYIQKSTCETVAIGFVYLFLGCLYRIIVRLTNGRINHTSLSRTSWQGSSLAGAAQQVAVRVK